MPTNAASADAWCDQGVTACEAGDYARALDCYTEAMKLDPTGSRPHYERGVTLECMQRAEDAEASYAACLALEPAHDMALTNLGTLLRARGQLPEAIAEFDKAVRANPAREEAWFNKGMCHRDQGQFQPAVTSFEHAVKLSPSDALNWHWLGVALQDLGRPRDALVAFAASRRLSVDAKQTAMAIHRSGLCGQRAAMGPVRPGRDSYFTPHVPLIPAEHRRPALQIVLGDYQGILSLARGQSIQPVIHAVEQELESLRHAINRC